MAEVKNPSTEGYDPEWLAVSSNSDFLKSLLTITG
jgi:hypothetical protein